MCRQASQGQQEAVCVCGGGVVRQCWAAAQLPGAERAEWRLDNSDGGVVQVPGWPGADRGPEVSWDLSFHASMASLA